MEPIWHLDEPSLLLDPKDKDVFRVKGWIANTRKIDTIRVAEEIGRKEAVSLSFFDRPNLNRDLDFKGLWHTGFKGERPFEELKHLNHITIEFNFGGKKFEIIAPVNNERGALFSNKKEKLKRLRPHLLCPHCMKGDLDDLEKCLSCHTCSKHYEYNDNGINFLTDDFVKDYGISITDNISSNEYDKTAINIINRFHSGLVLDCGAGSRQHYYENVINYDVVSYPSTDILGVGEKLPFKDNTFDAVLSLAVLEHVKAPFDCADEIVRVLKKGGMLYCQAPFLQPFHGYPHHYYNMTQQGMTNLFKDKMDVHEMDVLNFGQPIHSLSWFLGRYVHGLPKKAQKKFLKMKVKDLLKPVNELITKPVVTELVHETKRDLACCHYMIAVKK